MELRQLEYFMVLSQELHFTKAADRLGITQPTLSHQIRVLENEIGFPLFDRVGKKIAITDVGLILSEQCNNIMSALHNAKEQVNELQQMKSGSLSIAALPGELTDLVSTLLLEFHKNYPDIKVSVTSTDDISEFIMQNKVDFAITIASSDLSLDNEKIMKIPLYVEEFYLAISKKQPLARKKQINFSEVEKLPLILFPEKHQCRRLLEQTCLSSQITLCPKLETSSITSLFDLVKSEFGIHDCI